MDDRDNLWAVLLTITRRKVARLLEHKGTQKRGAGKVMLISPGDSLEGFKNREPDVSEQPWIYLLALLILIAEQAMAVHLSFHLKGSDAHAPAPARAAA